MSHPPPEDEARSGADERRRQPAGREPERVDVLGVGVSAVDMDTTLSMVDDWIRVGSSRYVCFTGVHGVMESRSDTTLRSIYQRAGLATPDGMPLVWLLRAAGKDVERVYGPDLMRIELRDGRTVSVEGLAVAAQSIVAPVDAGNLQGTRDWRLDWWNDILDCTLFGDVFWTGRSYGVNLTNPDAYQVLSDESLRSPHNAHLAILARGGVPGLALWLILQASFAAILLGAYVRRRREGRHLWADLNLWLLAYWLAFLVNATFDVYLEGPQGGIWFWCVFGFTLAVLRLQPEGGEPPSPSLGGTSPSPRPASEPRRGRVMVRPLVDESFTKRFDSEPAVRASWRVPRTKG